MRDLLVVVPALTLGGAERSLVKLLNLTADSFERAHLVCLQRAEKPLLGELCCPERVHVHVMRAKSSASPLLWRRVRALIRGVAPQCVLGWSTFGNLVACLASRGSRARVVLSERNYFPRMFGRRGVESGVRGFLVRRAVRRLYAGADIVTANSAKGLEFLRRFVGAGPRYEVLPNTVDPEHIAERSLAQSGPNFSQGEGPRLLALGRLVYQKGFDVLLAALARVRAERNWGLSVVGDGPERNRLQMTAVRLGISAAVQWAGEQSNPYPWLRCADIVVVPSRYEGFPNVVMEAMALGKAVISSDCDTGPRELLERGRFGRLIPTGDIAALARAILELGDNGPARVALGTAARASVATRYAPPIVTPVYRRILGGDE